MDKLKSVTSYLAGNRVMSCLLGVLIVLVVSDGLISRFLVTRGLGQEGNPFLQTWVGEGAFLVIKVLGVLLCAFILWDIYKRWPKLALTSSFCFVILYTGIVIWNLCILFVAQF